MEDSDKEILGDLRPIDYAKIINTDEIYNLIDSKMKSPLLEDRWIKIVETLDIDKIDVFRIKFKNSSQALDLVRLKNNKKHLRSKFKYFSFKLNLGLVKAAELGSNRLIDYFIGIQRADINCICKINVI